MLDNLIIKDILAVLGILFLGKIISDVLLEERIERKEKEEANKIKDKYFN